MNNRYCYDPNGCGYIRVNKTAARNLLKAGVRVLLTPCKVSPVNKWGIYLTLDNRKSLQFDAVVNAYEYYNCSNALGRYASYWIYADWRGF